MAISISIAIIFVPVCLYLVQPKRTKRIQKGPRYNNEHPNSSRSNK